MQLGDRLRQARKSSNLSQVQVKNITEINNKTLSNYEKNVSLPDPRTLKILADLYKVTTDWLIDGNQNDCLKTSTVNSSDFSSEDLALLNKIKNLSPQKKQAIEILISNS